MIGTKTPAASRQTETATFNRSSWVGFEWTRAGTDRSQLAFDIDQTDGLPSVDRRQVGGLEGPTELVRR
jgi:hypothetical protein